TISGQKQDRYVGSCALGALQPTRPLRGGDRLERGNSRATVTRAGAGEAPGTSEQPERLERICKNGKHCEARTLANVIVVGAQFGDEGKAKVTDLLSRNAHVVVRYQGGSNAGHTVVVDGETYKFHLIPSGILYKDTICLLGPGMVIDPRAFISELGKLIARGLDASLLKVSTTARVTRPYHLAIDAAEEDSRGNMKIGTTKRGIGPTYADKCDRIGIRVEDLLDPDVLKAKLDWIVPKKNIILERLYNLPAQIRRA